MRLKRKTQLIELMLLGTFLVSCASCNRDFDWNPRPFVGDSSNERIVNGQGEDVMCSQPSFDTFTCFDSENIAELRTAIGQVEDKRARKRLQEALKQADEKVWRAKQNK